MKQQLGKLGALGAELEISERVAWEPRTTREEADALALAPLATLRATTASPEALSLIEALAERYPRPPGAKGKHYARIKTKADYANAVAAFVAELLSAHAMKYGEGWLRCSLDKDQFKGGRVSWRMFEAVRQSWAEAGLPPAGFAKPLATYELKDQNTVTMLLRAQRNF